MQHGFDDLSACLVCVSQVFDGIEYTHHHCEPGLINADDGMCCLAGNCGDRLGDIQRRKLGSYERRVGVKRVVADCGCPWLLLCDLPQVMCDLRRYGSETYPAVSGRMVSEGQGESVAASGQPSLVNLACIHKVQDLLLLQVRQFHGPIPTLAALDLLGRLVLKPVRPPATVRLKPFVRVPILREQRFVPPVGLGGY